MNFFIHEYDINKTQNRVWRDGSEVRALAAFAEDGGSLPSTHIEVHNHL